MKVPKCWDWAAVLSDGFFGCIIVLWHKSIGMVTPVALSRRALHIVISVVYNLTRFHNKCFLWNELSKITSLLIPWLIVGDFNTVLHRTEHKG